MLYIVKTRFGEYEIPESERDAIKKKIALNNQAHFNLSGNITIKGDWDMFPVKEKGGPATEPWGKPKKQCCDHQALQVRHTLNKVGIKRYMKQCMSCGWKGVQMKIADVIAEGCDPETVEQVIEKPDKP